MPETKVNVTADWRMGNHKLALLGFYTSSYETTRVVPDAVAANGFSQEIDSWMTLDLQYSYTFSLGNSEAIITLGGKTSPMKTRRRSMTRPTSPTTPGTTIPGSNLVRTWQARAVASTEHAKPRPQSRLFLLLPSAISRKITTFLIADTIVVRRNPVAALTATMRR